MSKNQLWKRQIPSIDYNGDLPIDLAKSLEGKYFLGSAEQLSFNHGTSTWARLYNPTDSKVNLHIDVWTVTVDSSSPYNVNAWFNANPPGKIMTSYQVAPANYTLYPIPTSSVKLEYALDCKEDMIGGVNVFDRIGQPQATMEVHEQGKFILPPGGSFLIQLSSVESVSKSNAKIAFRWWEEPIY